MNVKKFIETQIEEIKKTVGSGKAISALSGGVDSSACTVLAHRALGPQLKSVFIDHGLMRAGEPQEIAKIFAGLGIAVDIADKKKEYFRRSQGQGRPGGKAQGLPLCLLQLLRQGGPQEQGPLPDPGHDRGRHHRDPEGRQDPAQHPRADRHRPGERLRLQGHRAAQGALQARGPPGGQRARPARARSGTACPSPARPWPRASSAR